MAKRKEQRRYHIELHHAKLTQVQSEYAKAFMDRKLIARNPDHFFIHEAENETGSVHYVFRDEALGKEISEAIDHEVFTHTDGCQVWVNRHWVTAPDRRMTGLFDECGIVAAIRPGDDFIGTHYHQIKGKVTQGYFNNNNYPIVPELGHITRLWFQGSSKEVWNARRRFRYEMKNDQMPTYRNIAHALEKASEQLGEHACIGIVNSAGDHYVVTNRGVSASPFMSPFEWGEAWLFEYQLVELDVPRDSVIYPGEQLTDFQHSLKNASAKQAMKRRGTFS